MRPSSSLTCTASWPPHHWRQSYSPLWARTDPHPGDNFTVIQSYSQTIIQSYSHKAVGLNSYTTVADGFMPQESNVSIRRCWLATTFSRCNRADEIHLPSLGLGTFVEGGGQSQWTQTLNTTVIQLCSLNGPRPWTPHCKLMINFRKKKKIQGFYASFVNSPFCSLRFLLIFCQCFSCLANIIIVDPFPEPDLPWQDPCYVSCQGHWAGSSLSGWRRRRREK